MKLPELAMFSEDTVSIHEHGTSLLMIQGDLLAMVVPVFAVITAPHWSFRETVPSVVGFQVSVVGSPASNE